MSKCGKSIMPECKYFTTGGCVSPFNCPYKCEQESITTATSTPLNPNVIYTTETDKDKEIARLTAENERLRKQLTDGKCVYLSDSETAEGCVQSPCPNYKTVEDILKENAELTARLATAEELPVKVGDTIYEILVSVHREWIVKEIEICEIWTKIDAQEKSSGAHWRFDLNDYNKTWFTDPEKAKAEFKGGGRE